MCKLRSRKDYAKCNMGSPPTCGVGYVRGGRQGVPQPSQVLSHSLKHTVLQLLLEIFLWCQEFRVGPIDLEGFTPKRMFLRRMG